jgi:hypothetical protein
LPVCKPIPDKEISVLTVRCFSNILHVSDGFVPVYTLAEYGSSGFLVTCRPENPLAGMEPDVYSCMLIDRIAYSNLKQEG